jgi:hypothetical protein
MYTSESDSDVRVCVSCDSRLSDSMDSRLTARTHTSGNLPALLGWLLAEMLGAAGERLAGAYAASVV